MYGKGLRTLSLAAFASLTTAFALVFFYAPNDADQGFVQKIFYLHVPLAIVALCGFVADRVYRAGYLLGGRDPVDDPLSVVPDHRHLIHPVRSVGRAPDRALAPRGQRLGRG